MDPNRSVVLEFINKIFLEYSPQYQSIKQIAEKDLAEELLNQIKEFLENREIPKKETTIAKKFFENPANVREEDINDIVDAFVRMRDSGVLDQIDNKSINGILILFNQWIAQKNDSINISGEVNMPANMNELEQQIMELQPQEVKELELYPEQRNLYQTVIQQDIYSSLPQGMHLEETNPYFAKTEYKAMRPNL